MRLLRRDDGKVSFTKDLADAEAFSLKYAVLSHRWGPDDEEVTFDDITQGTITKAGWRKIQFCIDQTIRDGLDYFWIDTCCINKRSETELSRSLISMYRWYSHADRCYVYLSDTADLKASRWFTRGWTLQELIAPTILEFFWQGAAIGTKTSLETTIGEITGIPIEVLRGRALSEYSVQERMQWQAQRHTREPEDLVYAMLGLLDVAMPILYGEGLSKAQGRLNRELSFLQHNVSIPPMRTTLSMTAAEKTYRLMLRRKEGSIGDHASTLSTLHELGLICSRQGKVADAEDMLERCLAGREELLGSEHLSTLDTVFRLGELYHFQLKSMTARTLLLRALHGREKALGLNDSTTLQTVSALGRLYLWLGKYTQAEEMFMRVLRGRESSEPDHVLRYGALHDLGTLLRTQVKFPDATQKFKQALEGRERLLGREHTDTLESVHQLGLMLDTQGFETKDAVKEMMAHKDRPPSSEVEQLLTRALTGFEQALGPHHESTLRTVMSLAYIHAKYGRNLAKAEELYLRVQHSNECTKRFPPEHPRALFVVQKLARLGGKQDRFEEAEQLLKRCLEGYATLDEACPSMTLQALHELAIIYKSQDKLQDAEAAYLQLLDEGKKIGLGLENYQLALTMIELMLLYHRQRKYEEAQAFFVLAKGSYNQMDPMNQYLFDLIDAERRSAQWQPGPLIKGLRKIRQLFQRRQPSQHDEVKLLECSE